MHVLAVAVAVAASDALPPLFSGSAQFERWVHFKFSGIPAVATDALGTAAIADTSCRLLGKPFDGYYFWRQPTKAAAVIKALKDVPLSKEDAINEPSNFTLTVAHKLASPCAATAPINTTAAATFPPTALASAEQNWYHALCAPADSPSWSVHGYDPAYQPQQMALTAGLMCIAACDVGKQPFPSDAVGELMAAPAAARDAVCAAIPWGATSGRHFADASSHEELAAKVAPLLRTPCGCEGGGWPPRHSPVTVAGAVAAGLLLAFLFCLAYRSCRQSTSITARERDQKLLEGTANSIMAVHEPDAAAPQPVLQAGGAGASGVASSC